MKRIVWVRQRRLTRRPWFPQRDRFTVVGQRWADVERYTYADGWTAFVRGAPVTHHRRRCDAKRAVEMALVALGS